VRSSARSKTQYLPERRSSGQTIALSAPSWTVTWRLASETERRLHIAALERRASARPKTHARRPPVAGRLQDRLAQVKELTGKLRLTAR
jgi:hypothetical protein